MTYKASDRYDLRKDGFDPYGIFDTATGRTVFVDAKPYAELTLDEADIYLDHLNAGNTLPDKEMVQ